MEDGRRVLVLAALADDGGLAEGVHGRSERRHCAASEEVAQFLAGLHQLLEILDKAPGKGILDHRDGRNLLYRPRGPLAAILEDFLDHRQHFSDAHELFLSTQNFSCSPPALFVPPRTGSAPSGCDLSPQSSPCLPFLRRGEANFFFAAVRARRDFRSSGLLLRVPAP